MKGERPKPNDYTVYRHPERMMLSEPIVKTIQLNEVLTMDAQRGKLSESAIILLSRCMRQIDANISNCTALEAAQIMEKLASVWSTVQGTKNPMLANPGAAFNFSIVNNAVTIVQGQS